MDRWRDPPSVEVSPSLRAAVGGHSLVAETLVRRGITTAEEARAFLDAHMYCPADPEELPDLAEAAAHIRRAIASGDKIAVWGDFDADGQTATSLLIETLKHMGAEVSFHIPSRSEGHGLHAAGVQDLIAGGAGLIVTCDTGVTANEAVVHANSLGARVIITDHHVPGKELPPAVAVINPHRLPENHSMSTLPGVGVAYQLARALAPEAADDSLDLVALGTVADVATLVGDARYLVQRGLEALRTTSRLGLQAVYAAAGLRPSGITEEQIGFVLGPRLNALGRLDDASLGVELLTTDNPTRARILAADIEGLNVKRQSLSKLVFDSALALIERDPSLLDDYHAMVLSSTNWPSGIVGIVAGRLTERFGRPAVLISSSQAGMGRGSGRSVPGVNLVAALTDCSNLLRGFGGHAGAAGFSIDPTKILQFRRCLSHAVAGQLKDRPEPTLQLDGHVALPELTLSLADDLGRLAPFGQGNPPLALAISDLRLVGDATIGRADEHRRLVVEDAQGHSQNVFWWHGAGRPAPPRPFDLAVTIRRTDYRGTTEIQVEWLDWRGRDEAPVEAPVEPAFEIVDYRSASRGEATLRGLALTGEVQIWAEATQLSGLESRTRNQLTQAEGLVIWTLPPGPGELREALEVVQPWRVLLFAHDPSLFDEQVFVQRLAGLAKYTLNRKLGVVRLDELAAAVAERIVTVEAGLELLEAMGQVRISGRTGREWQLEEGTGSADSHTTSSARARLEALLTETKAYRSYALQAPAAAVLRG
ncbi:single-stranded-DNA-specific exonuclease RecJ [Chloroflexota bacterium]